MTFFRKLKPTARKFANARSNSDLTRNKARKLNTPALMLSSCRAFSRQVPCKVSPSNRGGSLPHRQPPARKQLSHSPTAVNSSHFSYVFQPNRLFHTTPHLRRSIFFAKTNVSSFCPPKTCVSLLLSHPAFLSLTTSLTSSKTLLAPPKQLFSNDRDFDKLKFEIPRSKIATNFSKSSGPGGQNVNKLNTKAEIRFNVDTAFWIPPEIRERFIEQNSNRITGNREFIMTSERGRTQHGNLEDCFEKLEQMLLFASVEPKERIPTEPPEWVHEEKKKEKQKRSEVKKMRKVSFDVMTVKYNFPLCNKKKIKNKSVSKQFFKKKKQKQMSSPLIHDIIAAPVSSLLVLVNVGVYIYYSFHKNVSLESVGFLYDQIIREKEYWRVITSAFFHANALHILFNMNALWSCRIIELTKGSFFYLKYSVLLLVGSVGIILVIYWFMINKLQREEYRYTVAVGYSCIIFGWMTLLQVLTTHSVISVFGAQIPVTLAPFGFLILTSLLVRRASFVGHLSGIALGYLIGLFEFFGVSLFPDWIFFSFLIWFVVGSFASLKYTKDLPKWIEIEENAYLPISHRFIENG